MITPRLPGETFVFTQFSGEPQCFLTERQRLHFWRTSLAQAARDGWMIVPTRVPTRSTSTGLRASQMKRYAALPCRNIRSRAAGASGRMIIPVPRRLAVAGVAGAKIGRAHV